MGADCRTILLGEHFVDTFAIFGEDGFTKIAGLSFDTVLTTVRYEGERLQPQPTVTIDEPDADGEYRIRVAGSTFTQPGLYHLEITSAAYKVNLATDIQVIRNLADVIQGMYLGTQTVTLQVRDTQNVALSDVAVQVFDVAMSTIVQAGKTHQASGDFMTTLDAGQYHVVLGKSLCTFANPYLITIANIPGSPQVVPLIGERLTIAPPPAPHLCRLYGYLISMTGTVSDAYAVRVEGKGLLGDGYPTGADAQGVALDSKTVRPDRTTGMWQIDLVRGCYVRIRIDAQRIDRALRVPDAATANFRDLQTATYRP